MKTRVLLSLLALFLLSVALSAAESETPQQLRGFPESSLTITHAGGRDSFRIWIADTPERQQQGLMFIRELAADRGMLFPQREARVMSMWMKNTYIPLDMIFIGEGGRITGITANTRPQSLETITSPGPIIAVLELKGGEAKRRGLAVGGLVAAK
jgi:uncharacterized membrane protein (UPF0127 family)